MRVPAPDISDVALKVLNVDGVKADDGGIKADVGFGDSGAIIVGRGVGGKVGFSAVKRAEEGIDGLFVGLLGS